MEEEPTNSTFNFVRMILLGLCSNFNEQYMPQEGWACEFKSEYYYKLRSLKGKTLKFTTLQKLPFSGTIEDENGILRGIGLAFDLIHEIQKRVGFYYNITLPEHNVIGNQNEGIIKMLKNKEVDMAVAFIPIMHMLEDVISYSTALAEFEWVLLMARPTASASGSGLLAPFQKTVWVMIFISLMVAGPTMYFIVYLRIKFTRNNNSNIKPYSLNACFWFVYGALMKQGSTLSPVYDSSRLFFATWWIFITILTSFYTANLTAFLTLSQFTLTIKTTKDIYSHRKHWMADKGSYEEALIYNENSFDHLQDTIPKYGRYTSEPMYERLKKVMKGEIYITEKLQGENIMMKDYLNKTRNNVKEKKRCTFVLTPKSILAKPVGFAYQKGSELKALLDPTLLNFLSGGIISHLLRAELPMTSVCPLNLANRERKLLNSDLATTYAVALMGFGFGLIAFIGEVIVRLCSKKPTQETSNIHISSKVKLQSSNSTVIIINENKSKPLSNDTFMVHEYYREMMPSIYLKHSFLNENSNSGLIDPYNKPENILYQYLD